MMTNLGLIYLKSSRKNIFIIERKEFTLGTEPESAFKEVSINRIFNKPEPWSWVWNGLLCMKFLHGRG
ncbi:hypothetical protein RIR_jg1098.t1 [Rhizophagus irregularis DAOM 181602=DAOM 197198]|nr:hypothetical protein RIR_jg1098.t1 [Rhizophagus irregularis DAOM 181602=DAOM 197198]